MDNRIDRIRDEMAASPNDGMIEVVGSFLSALAEVRPDLLDKLADEKKSIKGAIGAMEAKAKKHKTGNYAALDYVSGIKIVLGYYGIKLKDAEIMQIGMTSFVPPEVSVPVAAKPQTSAAEAADDEFDLDALLEG